MQHRLPDEPRVELLETLLGQVLETGKVATPGQIDFADGAVALLGHDDLRLAGILLGIGAPPQASGNILF